MRRIMDSPGTRWAATDLRRRSGLPTRSLTLLLIEPYAPQRHRATQVHKYTLSMDPALSLGWNSSASPADLPLELLDDRVFRFPPSIDAWGLSRIWPTISYVGQGQGQAYTPPTLQPA
jgi:hypothetical protein